MLRVAYIASDIPMPTEKLSTKELLHNAAVETLAIRKHQDREKANLMFTEERAEIALKQIKLAELLAKKHRRT